MITLQVNLLESILKNGNIDKLKEFFNNNDINSNYIVFYDDGSQKAHTILEIALLLKSTPEIIKHLINHEKIDLIAQEQSRINYKFDIWEHSIVFDNNHPLTIIIDREDITLDNKKKIINLFLNKLINNINSSIDFSVMETDVRELTNYCIVEKYTELERNIISYSIIHNNLDIFKYCFNRIYSRELSKSNALLNITLDILDDYILNATDNTIINFLIAKTVELHISYFIIKNASLNPILNKDIDYIIKIFNCENIIPKNNEILDKIESFRNTKNIVSTANTMAEVANYLFYGNIDFKNGLKKLDISFIEKDFSSYTQEEIRKEFLNFHLNLQKFCKFTRPLIAIGYKIEDLKYLIPYSMFSAYNESDEKMREKLGISPITLSQDINHHDQEIPYSIKQDLLISLPIIQKKIKRNAEVLSLDDLHKFLSRNSKINNQPNMNQLQILSKMAIMQNANRQLVNEKNFYKLFTSLDKNKFKKSMISKQQYPLLNEEFIKLYQRLVEQYLDEISYGRCKLEIENFLKSCQEKSIAKSIEIAYSSQPKIDQLSKYINQITVEEVEVENQEIIK